MPTDLTVTTVHDASGGFTALPEEPAHRPRHLTVRFDQCGGGFRVLLFGSAVDATPEGTHEAVLEKSAAEVAQLADRLRRTWYDHFICYEPASGSFPYADDVDLAGRDDEELVRAIDALHTAGYTGLMGLVEGRSPAMVMLRAQLERVLRRDGLLIRFESRDLHFPWPLLCLPPRPDLDPEHTSYPFDRFLGYRHQIEQTSCLEPFLGRQTTTPRTAASATPHRVRASLHTDQKDDLLCTPAAAAEVARLLSDVTNLTVRPHSDDLFDDIVSPDFADELMYFWCHGRFGPPGPDGTPPAMTIKLTDERAIEAHDITTRMTLTCDGGPFASNPFVFLNACHLGQLSSCQVHHLGMALLAHGAAGVLGPQAPVPVPFAAEFALQFLKKYLDGGRAGDILRELVHSFAETYRNPLSLLYSMHGGLDNRLVTSEPAL